MIALTRSLLAELLAPGNTGLLSRLDTGTDAVILGVDLAFPTDDPSPGIDPSIAAVTLAAATEHVGLIVAAAPQRDHPYNLARRLATLDHATGGRIGVLIGSRDPSAPPGSPWTTATPEEAAVDAVIVLRELWRSFPTSTIVADKETGVFAESHQILSIDHRGTAFQISGPLQVPWSPQLFPPVLARAGDPAAAVADVVIDATDFTLPDDLAELEALLTGEPPLRLLHPTLRSQFGLPPAVPPTGGRPAFPDPAVQKVTADVR